MKDEWEHNQPEITLGRKQLTDILQTVFPGRAVACLEPLSTGYNNLNYKIYMSGSDRYYLFRLYTRGAEIAEKELSLVKLVRKSVPVADFITVDTSCRKVQYAWAVMEWKEGPLLRDVIRDGSVQDIVRAAKAAGRTLAQIHRFSFQGFGLLDKNLNIAQSMKLDGETFLSFIEESLFHHASGRWLGGELTAKLWSFCSQYGPVLSEIKDLPVLVHSDFNSLNILMEPAGSAVYAVLDWEYAYSGSQYADIANLLRYEADDSLFEMNFIEAYKSQGMPLDDHWKFISKLSDLVALCDLLDRSTSAEPKRIHDLIDIITKTMNKNQR